MADGKAAGEVREVGSVTAFVAAVDSSTVGTIVLGGAFLTPFPPREFLPRTPCCVLARDRPAAPQAAPVLSR